MGDKALTCFLGCCVQLLQVLMEVKCSMKSRESQKRVGNALVFQLIEPSPGGSVCLRRQPDVHTSHRS